MRSWILAALALAFMHGPALADGPVITVSTNNTPLDREVLRKVSEEAFRRIGHGFRLVDLPSERSLRMANAGEVDGEGLRVGGLGTTYPNLVQIDEPFVRIGFVAFARDPSIKLEGWHGLAPHDVAFINGWKMFERQAANAKSVIKVDKVEQLFDLLRIGRVDLVLYTRADGDRYLEEHALNDVFRVDGALADVDMYLYLHRRHADIADKVRKSLIDMKKDGTYAGIVAAILKN